MSNLMFMKGILTEQEKLLQKEVARLRKQVALMEKELAKVRKLMQKVNCQPTSAEDFRTIIGQQLLQKKKSLKYGQFLKWIMDEFGWSARTAQRFMRAAKLKELENKPRSENAVAS